MVENTLAKHTFDKGFVSKIHKYLKLKKGTDSS